MNRGSADKQMKRGFLWTTLNRVSVIGLQFVSIIVLARLLMPEDFALIGVVMFFISISNILIDSGMGGSLVIKKDATDVDYSTLFIYNFLIAFIMYGLANLIETKS